MTIFRFMCYVFGYAHPHSYIGGWGLSNQEIVSCRAVRARGVLGQARFQPKQLGGPFPFPFDRAGLSLFPCETTYSFFPCIQDSLMISRILVISWVSMIPMSPSESK